MKRNTPTWFSYIWQRILVQAKWLTPGLGVKRWILLVIIGTTLLGVGFGVLILDFYRNAPDTWWLPLISFLSLRFLTRPLRALIFGGVGVALVLLGIAGMNRALLRPFMKPGKPILDAVSTYRRKVRGPRIVLLGGGTGLSTLLRGLKDYTNNLTAVVTVTDDGGSSGELRRSIGILPPGDIRNCLSALSNDETLLNQIFQYRFSEVAGLNGHTLGNLFITALTNITGSFEEAIAESGRVLAVQGQVLPATLHDVRLVANVKLPGQDKEIMVKGESQIPKISGQIQRVWLEPENPLAFPPSIQAILSADLIIVGPGSLYTSILPNLLVTDIKEAIRASRALKFYVCNVATQPGETDGFTCGDHIHALEKHMGEHIFDLIIINNNYEGKLSPGVDWVRPEEDLDEQYVIYTNNLIDTENPWRHHSKKTAEVIMDLFYERTGPLLNKED